MTANGTSVRAERRTEETVLFYRQIRSALAPGSVVLNVGCGRGASAEDPDAQRRELQDLRTVAREVIGIDVDPAAAVNPTVGQFRLIESERWPVADAAFDLCFADWVLEHVSSPHAFFSEVSRVLKPGGMFFARTPNRYGYLALFACLIPNRWHAAVLRRVAPSRQEQDVFPTLYRCNTGRCLRRALSSSGFDSITLQYPSVAPIYLAFCPPLYALGNAYDRWAPAWTRVLIFVSARRRGSAAAQVFAATGAAEQKRD